MVFFGLCISFVSPCSLFTYISILSKVYLIYKPFYFYLLKYTFKSKRFIYVLRLAKYIIDEKYIIKQEVNAFKCLRCRHIWIPRVPMEQLTGMIKEKPRICPKCKSASWDREKKRKQKRV